MIESLLIVVPGFPSDEGDTTCLPAVQTYVRALGRMCPELDLQVLSLHYPFDQRAYRWHGIPVRSVAGANRRGLRKLLMWYRAWHAIGSGSQALVHSFWVGESAWIGGMAALRLGCPHVASIGGQELRGRSIYSRLLRRMDFHLAAGSSFAAETALDSLGRSVDAVIPLGIDWQDLPNGHPAWSPRENGATVRDMEVLSVGSLIPLKRVQDVLAVARLLPETRFRVVGDGPLEINLRKIAPPNVVFTGSLPRKDVLRLMQRSRILLHPSEYESQGYVLLEALASGMRAVSREVGFACDSPDIHCCTTVEEMADAVRHLLDEPSPADARVPSIEETVRSYLQLYDAAVSARFTSRSLPGSSVHG